MLLNVILLFLILFLFAGGGTPWWAPATAQQLRTSHPQPQLYPQLSKINLRDDERRKVNTCIESQGLAFLLIRNL